MVRLRAFGYTPASHPHRGVLMQRIGLAVVLAISLTLVPRDVRRVSPVCC